MNAPEMLELRSGSLSAVVAPSVGGALTEFSVGRVPLLRPYDPVRVRRDGALGTACFAMVPFASRVAEGRAQFRGKTLAFGTNAPPDRHACLGTTWQRRWAVCETGPTFAQLEILVEDYAIPFHARQRVTLDGSAMTIEIEIVNLADERAPIGCGLHPFFVKRSDATLTASCAEERFLNGEHLPKKEVPTATRCAMTDGIPVTTLGSVREFAGCSGSFEVSWVARDVRVRVNTVPACAHLLFWRTHDDDNFCIEPMTHGTDAINRIAAIDSLDGLRELDSRACFRQQFRFSVEGSADDERAGGA